MPNTYVQRKLLTTAKGFKGALTEADYSTENTATKTYSSTLARASWPSGKTEIKFSTRLVTSTQLLQGQGTNSMSLSFHPTPSYRQFCKGKDKYGL